MTKRNLSNIYQRIKSFVLRLDKKTFRKSLEKAYCEQALELHRLKRLLKHI